MMVGKIARMGFEIMFKLDSYFLMTVNVPMSTTVFLTVKFSSKGTIEHCIIASPCISPEITIGPSNFTEFSKQCNCLLIETTQTFVSKLHWPMVLSIQ